MDRHQLGQLRNQTDKLLRHGSPSCIRFAQSVMIENFDKILNFALDLSKPKPQPKHTIADNFPAGGLTATEPCMFCEDYERLQAALRQAKEEIGRLKDFAKYVDDHITNTCNDEFVLVNTCPEWLKNRAIEVEGKQK